MQKNLKWIGFIVLLLVGIALGWGGGAKETAGPKSITLLTWNLPHYADTINQWIKEYQDANKGVTVNWVDKKGTELPTYFQTQLAAGSPPDVIDIQGALWYQYAADGILLDLTPYFQKEPEVKNRFEKNILEAASNFGGKYYMVPFYTPSSVLFYNKILFKEAGISEPPKTMDELVAYAKKLTKGTVSGFLTLNFDWLYWPLFRANGVEILTPDGKKAAFNTPAAVQTLKTLAELTASGVISKVSWTGRWAEPNGEFGAGNAAMLHAHLPALRAFQSQSKWANDQTVGVAPFPGKWSVPNYHGFCIVSKTKYPDVAWGFVKMVTNDKWATTTATVLGTLSGNSNADNSLIKDPNFSKTYPVVAESFKVALSVSGNLTGITRSAKDAQIKDAVYSNIQKALFGQIPADQALAEAEKAVNRILAAQ